MLDKLAITAQPYGLTVLIVLGTATHAETPQPPADATASSAVPQLSAVLDASGIVLTGYVDGTYEHLSTAGEFNSGMPSRVFDYRADSFTVHQAAVTVAMQPKEGFGALVNVTTGTDAEVIKSHPNTGGANFDVTQAFVQYAHGPLLVMGGKFVTLAGVEVINETQDTNFSRSILFGFAIPFTNTGVRAIYAIGDQLSVTAGVNNGWDQVTDANRGKTMELGLSWTPSKTFSTIVNAYVGDEPVDVTTRLRDTERDLVDVIVTWSATEQATVIVNYDWARQAQAAADGSTARWDGVAGYFNYQFTERWHTSLRLETFNDHDGYRTGIDTPQPGNPNAHRGQIWTEATLTAGYAPTKHVEMRVELRTDKSNVSDAFIAEAGPQNALARLTGRQNSAAIQVICKY